MIKILKSETLRNIDQETIQKQGLQSHELMERAAEACVAWIDQQIPAGIGFLIVCGPGNNGGDGLAIARKLWERGKDVRVRLASANQVSSEGFKHNLGLWTAKTGISPDELSSGHDWQNPETETLIIDALLGAGLSRPPEGLMLELIGAINGSSSRVISIDMPSGLFGDQATSNPDSVIKAWVTLCLGAPRQALFYPEYEVFCGNWQFLDIGLDPDCLAGAPAIGFIPSHPDISALQPERPVFGHKGTFGHALLVAGSRGKCGASLLATQACLRSGAGRVTLRCPSDCLIPVQTAAPEAMVSPDECSDRLSEIIKPELYSAIGFGPGTGTDPQTANVLKRLLQDFSGPMVIDADGLNILAENPTWLQFMPAGTILTPHPGEFERLVGRIANPFERTEALRSFAKRYGCFVALKGRFTCIACPDGQLYFNPTGNNGLAKGGSGDVLTGLICGLLASGHSAMRAVLTGVYVHGLAADIYAREEHILTMTPGTLPNYFGQAYREIGGES